APRLAPPLPTGLRTAHALPPPGTLPRLPARHHRPARSEILPQRLRILVPPRGRPLRLARAAWAGPRGTCRGRDLQPSVPGPQRGFARPGLAGPPGFLVAPGGPRAAVAGGHLLLPRPGAHALV